MASSVIEDARALAEDADLYDRELAHLLLALQQPQVPHRNRLATEHRASDLANRIVSRSIALRHALDPTNQDRQDEIDALAGNTKHDASSDSTADLAEFYQRLAKVKDYHRKYPNAQNVRVGTDRQVDFAALENNDPEWLDKRFTGDEGLGRYLDLHQTHPPRDNPPPPAPTPRPVEQPRTALGQRAGECGRLETLLVLAVPRRSRRFQPLAPTQVDPGVRDLLDRLARVSLGLLRARLSPRRPRPGLASRRQRLCEAVGRRSSPRMGTAVLCHSRRERRCRQYRVGDLVRSM